MSALPWVLLAAAVVGGGILFLIRNRHASRSDAPPPSLADRIFEGEEEGLILGHMNEGILVLDRRLRPEYANASARVLLGLQEGALPARVPAAEVTEVARACIAERGPQERLVDVWFPEELTLRVQAIPLRDDSATLVVLQDASEELRVQRIRTQFVANASHELKSPVAGLQALAEAVGEAARDDPGTAVRFAGRLVEEAERLGRLVSDLLDLSRLEDAGRVPDEPCDLSEIVRMEVERLGPSARGDIIAFTSDIEPHLWVRGDAQQLGQMARNLLENAIQYTPAGGKVALALERSDGGALLRVSDTGVGIPEEAQKRVFERFYRVDEARSRKHGGTGLGLAIAKHVAELHGGTIELTSEVGRGSTFDVRFPTLGAGAHERTSQETA